MTDPEEQGAVDESQDAVGEHGQDVDVNNLENGKEGDQVDDPEEQEPGEQGEQEGLGVEDQEVLVEQGDQGEKRDEGDEGEQADHDEIGEQGGQGDSTGQRELEGQESLEAQGDLEVEGSQPGPEEEETWAVGTAEVRTSSGSIKQVVWEEVEAEDADDVGDMEEEEIDGEGDKQEDGEETGEADTGDGDVISDRKSEEDIETTEVEEAEEDGDGEENEPHEAAEVEESEEPLTEENSGRIEEKEVRDEVPQWFTLIAPTVDDIVLLGFSDKEMEESVEVEAETQVDVPSQPVFTTKRTSKVVGSLTAEQRAEYMKKLAALTTEHAHLQRTNTVLHKRLVEHYKTRKSDGIFVTAAELSLVPAEMGARLAENLEKFGDLQDEAKDERDAAAELLDGLAERHAELKEDFEAQLDSLIDMERATSVGLTDSRNGKTLNERAVERMLDRHRRRLRALVEQRIIYIKQRDAVAAKEAAIRSLEDLGDGTKMADYEQLRVENQNLNDKVEERDEELAKFRHRVADLMTAYSHMREKLCAAQNDNEQRKEALRVREHSLDQLRCDLTRQKVVHDKLRSVLLAETTDAGLLTRPQLLRDFEQSEDVRDQLRAELVALRAAVADELAELTQMRELCGRAVIRAEQPGLKRPTALSEHMSGLNKSRKQVGQPVELSGSSEDIFQMQ